MRFGAGRGAGLILAESGLSKLCALVRGVVCFVSEPLLMIGLFDFTIAGNFSDCV